MKKKLVVLFAASLIAGSTMQAGLAFDKALDRKSYSSEKEYAASLDLLAAYLFGWMVSENSFGFQRKSVEDKLSGSLGFTMLNFAGNLLSINSSADKHMYPIAGKAAEEIADLPADQHEKKFELYKGLYTQVYNKIQELVGKKVLTTPWWTVKKADSIKFGATNWY